MPQTGPNNESQQTSKQATSSASTKRPYKVVLESVTQEKKKLRSDITYELDAPSGYTFVPVGAPELTEYCRELSRKKGLRVFIVSAEPKNKAHKNPNNISHHIHRLGYHFSNGVVDVACEWLGYTSRGPKYVRNRNSTTAGSMAIARRLDNHAKRLGESGSNASPDREREKVAGAIKDLFPKIPTEDQEAIVTRAFEEGTARVGNADLPLARRVQLAVVAHIRHTKTDYDTILKNTNWQTARQSVEQACLEQIVKWRGEDDSGEEELEDIFQEVIVLDDETDTGSSRSRDSSVEIISSKPFEANPDNNRHGEERDSHVQTSHALFQGQQPEIVHVQPRRALAPPPVLQRTFRRRWNEARARVGFVATGDNGNQPLSENLAVHGRAPEASNRVGHYTAGFGQYSSMQTSDTRPRSRREQTSSLDVYPSIELSGRSKRVRSPRPPRETTRSHPNQEPLVLYDKPMNMLDFDANRPFYVPDNRGPEPRFIDYESRYDPRHYLDKQLGMRGGDDLSIQGVKRKPLTDPDAYLREPERVYLHSPLKRVRLTDDNNVLPALSRHQHRHGVPQTRSSANLRYDALEYPSPREGTDSYERFRTAHSSNDRAPPSKSIEYAALDTAQRQTRSMRSAAVVDAATQYPLQTSRPLPAAYHDPSRQHRLPPAEYNSTNGSARYHHHPSQPSPPSAPHSGYHLRQRRGPVAAPTSTVIHYPTLPVPPPPPPPQPQPQPQLRTLTARDGQVHDQFERMRVGRR